jgi:hypothetical protein
VNKLATGQDGVNAWLFFPFSTGPVCHSVIMHASFVVSLHAVFSSDFHGQLSFPYCSHTGKQLVKNSMHKSCIRILLVTNTAKLKYSLITINFEQETTKSLSYILSRCACSFLYFTRTK